MAHPGSGEPWEWRTLGVVNPGSVGPWEWRTQTHVGGSVLAHCPTAHRVQGCLLGVAVPVRHCPNLPNRSLSICVGYCQWSLPTLCGKGGPLSPVCSYYSH